MVVGLAAAAVGLWWVPTSAAGQAPPTGVRIIKNGSIPDAALPVRYQDLDEPLLQQFSKRENLPRRVGSSSRQFDQIVELRDWVAGLWKPGTPDPSAPWSSLELFDWMRARKTSGNSRQYSLVLLQSLAALGHTARFVELGSRENPYVHFVVEVWSNDFNKWMVMDALYNTHFERKDVPMSALEVHDAFITKRLSDVVIMRAPRRNGHPDPYRVQHGTTEFYHFVRFHMKADHLSKPDEPPVDRKNDMIEWLDKRVVQWEAGVDRTEFPREQLTARKTADRALVDAPINQVHVAAASDSGAVTLTLRNNVRQFQHYEYRITTAVGTGEWLKHTESTLRLPQASVARQVDIRGVNVRGVGGPLSIVEIN